MWRGAEDLSVLIMAEKYHEATTLPNTPCYIHFISDRWVFYSFNELVMLRGWTKDNASIITEYELWLFYMYLKHCDISAQSFLIASACWMVTTIYSSRRKQVRILADSTFVQHFVITAKGFSIMLLYIGIYSKRDRMFVTSLL